MQTPDTFRAYSKDFGRILSDELQTTDYRGQPCDTNQLVERLEDLRTAEGTVHLVGNGGSSSILSHMHNDLMKCDRIRAQTYTETSTLTAYTNDESYDVAYAQQLRLMGRPGDLLIAVSSSGRSQNILNAVAAARHCDMHIATLSGFDSTNPLRLTGDINFFIPSHSYGYVELGHAVILHYLTDRLALPAKAGALV